MQCPSRLVAASLLFALWMVGVVSADDVIPPQARVGSGYAYRIWIEKTGKNQVEARFFAATKDTVTVQKRDGQFVHFPLADLSALDRGYVEGVADAISVAKTRGDRSGGRESGRTRETETNGADERDPRAPSVAPDRRPDTPASSNPADHNLEVRINPEGMYRPAVPDPSFSGGARAPVYRHTSNYGDRRSPAKARIRIFNRGDKTIDGLTLAFTNDAPILSQRTVSVDALRGAGQLRPGSGVEFVVHWGILPNVKIGPGGATMKVAVTSISTK